MRIIETYRPVTRRASQARSGGSAFLLPADGEAPAAATTASAGANAITELPAEPAPGPGPSLLSDQAAASKGGDLLDALSGLQAGALGGDDGAALQRLAGLVTGDARAASPEMQGVLDAIGARVAVELERRGSAAPSHAGSPPALD